MNITRVHIETDIQTFQFLWGYLHGYVTFTKDSTDGWIWQTNIINSYTLETKEIHCSKDTYLKLRKAKENWRKAVKSLDQNKQKPLGKCCPVCGNTQLILLRTQKKKACNKCKALIDWPLDKGQSPVGY